MKYCIVVIKNSGHEEFSCNKQDEANGFFKSMKDNDEVIAAYYYKDNTLSVYLQKAG